MKLFSCFLFLLSFGSSCCLDARESIGVILWRQKTGSEYRAHIQYEDGKLEPVRSGDSDGRIERFPGKDSLDRYLARHGWEYVETRHELYRMIDMRLYER